MKKILCAQHHRIVPVVDELWICECASYGRKAYLKGAVEEARRMVDAVGGIARLRDQLEKTETEQRQASKERKSQGAEALRKAIRTT